MKKYTFLLRPIVFLLILVLLYFSVEKMCSVNDNASQMIVNGFFKEPNDSLDVILIGPSEFYSDYSAPLAWKKYGYTSYSLCMGGTPGILYKPMLEAALTKQSPKLIVFELNGFISGDTDYDNPIEMHRWIDNCPWSQTKFQTINTLIPKESQNDYFFNLRFSHVNWKQPLRIAKNTFERLCMGLHGQCYTKGFVSISKIDTGESLSQKQEIIFSPKGEQVLRELLQYCVDKELKNVLFIRFPHERSFSNPDALNAMTDIIHEYGYDTLNLNDSWNQAGLTVPNDFYDRDHMNVNGMEKMTDYLGSYITTHYDIHSKQSPKEIKRWNTCVDKTQNLIDNCRFEMQKGCPRKYYETSIYLKPAMEREKNQ